MVFCFFLRLQIRIFLRVPTVRLSFLKNPEGKTFNAVTVTCVHLFRTGLLMICYLRLGILLSKEGFIFLDLVHQRKRAIMPFVRLEIGRLLIIHSIFYWLNPRTYKGGGWIPPTHMVFLSFFPEDKMSVPDVFSSLIPRAHFETSLVMVSCYGYDIWRQK